MEDEVPLAFDHTYKYLERLMLQPRNDKVQTGFIDTKQNFLKDAICITLNQ